MKPRMMQCVRWQYTGHEDQHDPQTGLREHVRLVDLGGAFSLVVALEADLDGLRWKFCNQ